MGVKNISQINFFSVIFKIDVNEFSPWVEISERSGLEAKNGCLSTENQMTCVPTIYVG